VAVETPEENVEDEVVVELPGKCKLNPIPLPEEMVHALIDGIMHNTLHRKETRMLRSSLPLAQIWTPPPLLSMVWEKSLPSS